MRVLQVTTDRDRRGAQVFAAEMSPLLGDESWSVHTAALALGDGDDGLPFEVLGRRRLGIGTLMMLRRRIRSADVVIGYGSSTLPACGIASQGTSVPFIYRSIGDLRYWADSHAKRLRVRAMLSRAAIVVALWPQAAETICSDFGVSHERIRVIPRGVDPEHFEPVGDAERRKHRAAWGLPEKAPVAAIVGSLSSEKAIDVALSAASRIEGLYLLVAGDGPQRGRLEQFARTTLPDRVVFLGRVTDTRPVYAASDLLVLPSLSEGVPGVVLEAGMCGRPAVATDVGGTGSIIIDGVTGRLVAPGDVEAFAKAIEAVLPQARDLGLAARASYQDRFGLARVAQQWTQVLTSVSR